MTSSLLNPVLVQLRRAELRREGAGLTDGELLESFISRKDEAAFEALVRRHGPMVFGVCQRLLRNRHDAEDAFQAVFLVLARKAGSVRPRTQVANWLYGVAYRTALKARTKTARQRGRERQVTDMPEPEAPEPNDSWLDLRPLLDQELSHVPDKYRIPIVLCDLEARTGKEAARQLGWAEGTLASRLSRGRGLLAKRLTRRGVTLGGGSLATALSQQAASACVPASLVSSAVKAACAFAAGQALSPGLVSTRVAVLTQRGLRAVFLNRLKTALIVMAAIGVVTAGLGGVSFRAATDASAGRNGRRQLAQADVDAKGKAGRAHSIPSSDDLQGKWTGTKDGVKVDLTFTGERARWQVEFTVTRKPKEPFVSPTMGYSKGSDLWCIADRKAGCLDLHGPAMRKAGGKWDPRSRHLVGQVQRAGKGTLRLRVIPTGHQNEGLVDYDYPAVEGLILRRVGEPTKAQPAKADRKAGKPLLRVPLPERTMMTVALSADGKLLAVAQGEVGKGPYPLSRTGPALPASL